MIKSNTSPSDAIKENLETFCFEVGTEFEQYSKVQAARFVEFIGTKPVTDLGAGDGAGTGYFVINGNPVTAVDINPDKLDKIDGAMTVCRDIVSYLEASDGEANIFMHHVLEHIPNYEEVLSLISKKLNKGGYALIAVPKGDEPHSVHYVQFDDPSEIIPEGLTVVDSWSADGGWPELGIIARRD